MNIYPAMRASMGLWDYFVVKMRMKELAKRVELAHEIHGNKTLDKAIRLGLDKLRIKQEFIKYIAFSEDRFFNSIVVASLGGNPMFSPVMIDGYQQPDLLGRDEFNDTFGILRFNGKQHFYTLYGQHRLVSIKALLDQKEHGIPNPPSGFEDDEISVIMLVRQNKGEDFMKSYWKISSNLNRYVKPTDPDTNIIMNEEDSFAILTRRLLTDHEFFWWNGKANKPPMVKTRGKNLKPGEPFFISLRTLHGMNKVLLRSPAREKELYGSKRFERFRPDEDILDQLYEELALYWDSLIDALPVLRSDASKMRSHSISSQNQAKEDDEEQVTSHLLFWPVGQEILAKVARSLLNRNLPDADNPGREHTSACLSVLNTVNWELHSPPWRYLLLVPDPGRNGAWRMRSEGRKQAMKVGERILRMMTGIEDLSEEGMKELKMDWHALLFPKPDKFDVDRWWEALRASSIQAERN